MFWEKLKKSFYYASEGIIYTIYTQRNMKIHIAISLIVLLLGMWLHFTFLDALFILFSIGIIMGMELMNTAIETVVDLAMPKVHPLAKVAKDVAAGSVLLLTFIVMMVGFLIIFPYLYTFYLQGGKGIHSPNSTFFAFVGVFLLFITYTMKAYWLNKKVQFQPDVLVGILFYVWSYLFLYFKILSWVLLLSILILLFYRFKNGYTFLAFLQNFLISIGGFYVLYYLFF
ncbi:diacylglycerol kinase family protein [Tepidibacillus fermentans]|uniref:diacylglycerol kinase family protein n=1 Tax=Tepidibacillus fermentans TaxID=1281767 RepID=UPI001FB4D3E5|nr:diacylglycerol kinase family protein [Tepidibacillus fermentans]